MPKIKDAMCVISPRPSLTVLYNNMYIPSQPLRGCGASLREAYLLKISPRYVSGYKDGTTLRTCRCKCILKCKGNTRYAKFHIPTCTCIFDESFLLHVSIWFVLFGELQRRDVNATGTHEGVVNH